MHGLRCESGGQFQKHSPLSFVRCGGFYRENWKGGLVEGMGIAQDGVQVMIIGMG